MNGLRIGRDYIGPACRTTDPAIIDQVKRSHPNTLIIDDGIIDFARYFSPISNLLNNYYWLLNGIHFGYFPDGEPDQFFFNLIISQQKNSIADHILTKPLFLSEYMNNIIDDWCEIYGFDDQQIAQSFYNTSYDWEKIYPKCEICFFNIDAAYWEIFAKDDAILALVHQHISTLPGYYSLPTKISEKHY